MHDTTSNHLEGIWIDISIRKDEDLSLQEKFILAIIIGLDKGKGCYASNRYFADLLNVTSKRASDIIRSLITKEYVVSEIENFYKRTLTVVKVEEAETTQDEEKTEQPNQPHQQQEETKEPQQPKKQIIINGTDFTNWSAEEMKRALRYIPNLKEKLLGLQLKLIEVPSEWHGITQLAFGR